MFFFWKASLMSKLELLITKQVLLNKLLVVKLNQLAFGGLNRILIMPKQSTARFSRYFLYYRKHIYCRGTAQEDISPRKLQNFPRSWLNLPIQDGKVNQP